MVSDDNLSDHNITQGCVDEHPRCEDWVSQGKCVKNPKFMTHTCRESCGVCGFLSPTNKEDQVVGEKSYTDIKKADFDCGRYKNLFDIEKNTPSKAKELLELLEDPTCEDWVSQGECVKAPKLMNHFCSESCGEGNGEFSIFSYLQESISQ